MNKNDSFIPIVFGITGHRDLRNQDIPELEKEIKEIFERVKKDYPNTQLILLSPLAEGADRLAARTALSVGGISLVVPLPMRKDEYKKDFTTIESKEEFEMLLSKASTYFELPLIDGNTDQNISFHGVNRDRQYEQVGVYIARHSQILIALWDGVKKNAVGGTSQIVNFKLSGEPESYIKQKPSPLEPFEKWPVYHILTPRKSNPDPDGAKLKLKLLYPVVYKDAEEQQSFERSLQNQVENILKNTENFNKDIKKVLPKCINKDKSRKYELFTEGERLNFSDCVKRLYQLYDNVDMMSQYFSSRRKTTLFITSILSFLAAVAFIVYKRNASIILLCLYPLITFIALGYYKVSIDKKDYQNKHQDYRALAEGLRVQLFWKIAGLQDDVSDHYLIKHKSELDWTRNAIRMWNIPQSTINREHNNDTWLDIINEKWIKDQYAYFSNTAGKYNRKLGKIGKTAGRVARYSFPVAFIILVMHFLPMDNIKDIRSIIVFSTALVPLTAATYINYYNKMSYKELSKQYSRMASLFKRALDALEDDKENKSFDWKRRIVFELGIEALAENGDWLVLNRQKPIDVPVK